MSAGMKALIAYDGSTCAEAALDDLNRAGLPGEVEAVVVTVAELRSPRPPAMFRPILTAATGQLTAPVEAARGHNRIARFTFGSVAAAVAARAHCSVEVVRMEKNVGSITRT